MKNMYRLLMVIILMTSVSLIYAQDDHMKLLMPKWKASDCLEVISGSNYSIPGSRVFNGNRVGNMDQKVVKIDNPYLFPSMVPLIIWAKVPSGSKEVVWNIDSENVQVIGFYGTSTSISNNHIITPVNQSTIDVNVENPYRTLNDWRKDDLKYNWMNNAKNNAAFVKSNFYEQKNESQEKLYTKTFRVPKGYSYIIVQATQNEYVHISATSKNNDADKYSTAISHVKFYNENLRVRCDSIEEYALIISGGPESSPIPLSKFNNKVSYNINIINSSHYDLETDKVLLKFKPEGKWSTSTIGKLSSYTNQKIIDGNNGNCIIQLKNININLSSINDTIGVLKATASILYPTCTEDPKYVQMHLSFTKKPVIPPRPEKRLLAGIFTEYTGSGQLVLKVQNIAPDKDRVLYIDKITFDGGNTEEVNQYLSGTDLYLVKGRNLRNARLITIYYYLYAGDKRLTNMPIKLSIKK